MRKLLIKAIITCLFLINVSAQIPELVMPRIHKAYYRILSAQEARSEGNKMNDLEYKAFQQNIDVILGKIPILKDRFEKDSMYKLVHLNVFEEDLKTLRQISKKNSDAYTDNLLDGLSFHCTYCHNNKPKYIQNSLLRKNSIKSADYYYLLGHFNKANDIYRSQLKERLVTNQLDSQLIYIFDRLIMINLFIKPNISFERDLKKIHKVLTSDYLKKELARTIKKITKYKVIRLYSYNDAIKNMSTDFEDETWNIFHTSLAKLNARHELESLLKQEKNKNKASQLLYHLGRSYQYEARKAIYNIDEIYFKACILSSPHTKIAQKCFDALKYIVIFGFTGSAGTFLPDEVKLDLEKYEKMSRLKK